MKVAAVVLLSIATPISLLIWSICLVTKTNGGPYKPVSPTKIALSVLLPVYLGYNGIQTKKLTMSGAVAAMVMGWVLSLVSYSFLVAMITFYYLGSKATKFRLEKKRSFECDAEKGSVRNWVQVFANGAVALHLAMFYFLEIGCQETPIDFEKAYSTSWWSIGVVSTIACSAGDTFASELGTVLPLSQPYLITSLERVPKGTNGGVSIAGTACSCLGGFVVGVAYYVSLLVCLSTDELENSSVQWPVILVCTLSGLLGSLIDSLIGATCQFSGRAKDGCIVQRPDASVEHISGTAILDNHAVNFITSVLICFIMPRVALYIWWLEYESSRGIII